MEYTIDIDSGDIEFLICDISTLWRRILNIKTRELGISTIERRALFAIDHNPGCTQVQVASRVEVEPQNLTRVLDKLERMGWINKSTCPDDRRANSLYTTDKAKSLLNQIITRMDEIRPGFFSQFEDGDLQVLRGQLSQMKQNLGVMNDTF